MRAFTGNIEVPWTVQLVATNGREARKASDGAWLSIINWPVTPPDYWIDDMLVFHFLQPDDLIALFSGKIDGTTNPLLSIEVEVKKLTKGFKVINKGFC